MDTSIERLTYIIYRYHLSDIANAQDLYGCRVNGKIKENIDKNSESFITSGTELYDKSLYYVNRKKGSPYNKIPFISLIIPFRQKMMMNR